LVVEGSLGLNISLKESFTQLLKELGSHFEGGLIKVSFLIRVIIGFLSYSK